MDHSGHQSESIGTHWPEALPRRPVLPYQCDSHSSAPAAKREVDIPLLVNTFISRLELRTGKPIRGLTREALNSFMDYRWPGNIREMKSALEYAFTVTDKDTIEIDHLPPQLLAYPLPFSPTVEPVIGRTDNTERQQLIDALHAAGGNQSQADRMLGINRVTVWNRMRKYGIILKREIER